MEFPTFRLPVYCRLPIIWAPDDRCTDGMFVGQSPAAARIVAHIERLPSLGTLMQYSRSPSRSTSDCSRAQSFAAVSSQFKVSACTTHTSRPSKRRQAGVARGAARQPSASKITRQSTQQLPRKNTIDNQCEVFQRSCDSGYEWLIGTIEQFYFDDHDVGDSIFCGRYRRLAQWPKRADLGLRYSSYGLAGKTVGRGAHDDAGGEGSRISTRKKPFQVA